MQLDLRTLQTFHKMANRGASQAAERLSELTDTEAEVKVTKVKFVSPQDLEDEIDTTKEHVSVSVDLAGGPGGRSIVLFDQNVVADITDTMLDETGRRDGGSGIDGHKDIVNKPIPRSAATEMANMMSCGFIDGWADVLDVAIDVSPPNFRSGSTSQELFGSLETVGDGVELALMFQSRIELVGTEYSFRHFLIPSIPDLDAVLREDRELHHGFDFEKIIGFDQMVQKGAEEASNSMEMLTGQNTDVQVRHLNFVRVDSIPQEMGSESVVGVAFTYDGLPSGYLLFVFTEESAINIINHLLPRETDEPFGDLGQSALMELGNIMASGVLDGWANVLGTMIDHSPPEFIHDMGSAVIDPIAANIGQQQEYAFVFDTEIIADDAEFDCAIYSVCEEGDLEEALNRLNMDELHKARETPSFPISGDDGDL